jgi:hypothetical protein
MEWMRVMKILEIYEAGSGQKINLQKTSIFFSQNTSWEKKNRKFYPHLGYLKLPALTLI